MKKTDNYMLQMHSAQKRFLTYDQEKIIARFGLDHDGQYLYPVMLGKQYRLNRHTGSLERQDTAGWVDANQFHPVMTLLDLLCDASDSRYLTGRLKSMQDFGLMFHQNLLEDTRDATADAIDKQPETFRRACKALGGKPLPSGDIAYAFELFDGLSVGLRFWHGDEEFAPRIRYYWDENALLYLRYETMYYAVSLLLTQLRRESLLFW